MSSSTSTTSTPLPSDKEILPEDLIQDNEEQQQQQQINNADGSSDALPDPPKLSQEEMEAIMDATIQYAHTHGLLMLKKPKNPQDQDTQGPLGHVPHVLTPTLFSKRTFQNLKHIAPLFSLVVDKMSRDSEFLLSHLDQVLKVDPFTKRIADIYKKVYVKDGSSDSVPAFSLAKPQKLAMGIHRSDYMLHGEVQAYQVELNTIASAFAGLSQITQKMHHFVVKRFQLERRFHRAHLEECRSKEEVVLLMKEAFEAFVSQGRDGVAGATTIHTSNPKSAGKTSTGTPVEVLSEKVTENFMRTSTTQLCVMFVVQGGERNFADQKHVEFDLFEKYGICSVRATLAQIQDNAYLDEYGNMIYKDNEREYLVTVAYYRAGYTPDDYPSEKQWDARLLVEKSSAIKCPTTGYQLVGTKYIQYVMTLPGVLERYLSKKEANQVRSVFTGIYSMNNKEAVQRAIENPQDFVGKPQREGGGNLIFGDNLKKILQEMPEEVREGYILMERISPKGQEKIFCRDGQFVVADGVSELGTYCLFVGDSSHKKGIVANRYGGYLLRTKPTNVEDGGVASGVASMDSIAVL